MLKRTFFLLPFCALLLASAACSSDMNANTSNANASNTNASNTNATAASPPTTTTADAMKTPPADVVRASSDGIEASAGGSAEAEVRLAIADGYHINANPATGKYQIATVLEAAASEGITPGQPVYPKGETKKFAFAPDEPLAVYEKEVTVKLPVRVAGNATKGAHNLNAKLRVQPCDDQVCYPPRTIETSIPVTVK